MAVEVPALDEARPVLDLSKPMRPQSPSEDVSPQSPTENKIVLSAAQMFAKGAKKKTFLSPRVPTSQPSSANNTITLSLPPQRQQHQTSSYSNGSSSQEQQQPPADDSAAPSSSDNPFDFEFKNPFSTKRFHLGYRKSTDRNSVLLSPPATSATSESTPLTEEEENARLLQLKTFFSKFFKGKKDGKKGKGTDQVALTEDYQLWNNLTPLVFQPSAVFMGLSFMIDDKGSALTDKANVDWNMNVILALVKVRTKKQQPAPKLVMRLSTGLTQALHWDDLYASDDSRRVFGSLRFFILSLLAQISTGRLPLCHLHFRTRTLNDMGSFLLH
jgi:hypothetical protein